MRKENLVKLMKRMQKHLAAQLEELSVLSQEDSAAASLKQQILDIYRPLTDADIERVRLVQTTYELLDCSHHFHLHYGTLLSSMREYEARMAALNKKPAKEKKKKKRGGGNDEEGGEDEERNEEDEENEEEDEEQADDEEADDEAGGDTKVIKYASKKDRYHHCKMAGLSGLAKKFGLTPEQLGENLDCDYQKHEIDQWAVAPSDEAQNYVKEPYFSSSDQVSSVL